MTDKEQKLIRLLTQDKWDVDQETGCWNWNRRLYKGYGRISTRISNKAIESPAARVALRTKLGRPIKEGHLACHTCDNPACVNPDHLYEGTPKQNTADMMTRKRHNNSFIKGGLATRKLTEEQVSEIRRRVARGEYQADLAKEFGVSRSTISSVVKGDNYGFRGLDSRGVDSEVLSVRGRPKFSDEYVQRAVERVRSGEAMYKVERDMGMSRGYLSRIMSGKTRKDLRIKPE